MFIKIDARIQIAQVAAEATVAALTAAVHLEVAIHLAVVVATLVNLTLIRVLAASPPVVQDRVRIPIVVQTLLANLVIRASRVKPANLARLVSLANRVNRANRQNHQQATNQRLHRQLIALVMSLQLQNLPDRTTRQVTTQAA